MAGYPVIDPDGVDILNVDGSTTHYNLGETVPLSSLISRRYSWLVERGYLSETEIGFGGTETDLTDVEYIGFNTATPYHTPTLGQITWNGEEGTLDLALANDVIYENGMKLFMPPTKNNSGVQINKGEFVMATGAQGDRITIAKAVTDGSVDPQYMIGVAASDIPNGSETGLIIVYGILKGIDTDLWPVGTILYPDPTTPGWWTSTQPAAPSIKTSIAIVLRQQENTGRIYVRMNNGSVLGGTDSNVQFTTLADNDILTYDSTQEYWKNQNLAAAVDEVGGSITGLSNYLPLTGGTLTGDLVIGDGTTSATLTLSSEASSDSVINFRNAGVTRWRIYNDGDDYDSIKIDQHNAAGNFTGNALTISGATGQATFSNILKSLGQVNAANTTDSTSTTTGSIVTAGGLGVAKNLYVGSKLSIATAGYLQLENTTLDRIVLWGTKDAANAYAIGIENYTQYYRSYANHRWYINTAADDGATDVMELTSSQLAVNTTGKFFANGTVPAGTTNVLTADGTLDTTTGWTINSGWSIAGGEATVTAGAGTLESATTATTGYSYIVTVSMTRTSGSGNMGIYVDDLYISYGSTTDFSLYFTPKASNPTIKLTPTSAWAGTVYSVEVKRLSALAPSLTLYPTSDGGTSSYADIRVTPYGNNNAYSLYIGRAAGAYSGSNGYYSVGIGYNALLTNAGHYNVGIGSGTLASAGTVLANQNVAIGTSSLGALKSGGNNVFIGHRAGYVNDYSADSVAIGAFSQGLNNNSTGASNTSIGRTSLYQITTGSNNTAIGRDSFYSLITGSDNTAVGFNSGYYQTAGNYNTFLGAYAGDRINGTYNTSIGYDSGPTLVWTHDYGIFIGYRARPSADAASNEIVIGKDIAGRGSNTTLIGNASTTDFYPYGKLHVEDTTNSTSTTTGSVIISGGLGVAKAIYGGSTITSGSASAVIAGTDGFKQATYVASARNPIWRFGNSDGYGLSYFQGSASIEGNDTIGFHFGTATAAASILQVNRNNVVVSGTTDSSSTTTGSLRTAGGMAIAKALYVGGNVTLTSGLLSATSGNNTFAFNNGGSSVTPNFHLGTSGGKSVALLAGTGGTAFLYDSTGTFNISTDTKAAIDAGTSSGGTSRLSMTSGGDITISSTTDSTSYSNGSVFLSGGMGISKNLNVGWKFNGYGSVANQRGGNAFITGLTTSAGLSGQTGAQVIQTTLPRTTAGMYVVRVHGWHYAGARIDFTIRWYMYQGANDPNGNPGQIYTPQLIDLGTDTFVKRIGVKGDQVIIAIGDTTSNTSYFKVTVDCHFVNGSPTDAAISGWSVATNTTTSPYTFGADYEPITLTNQAMLMIQGATQTFSGNKTFSGTTTLSDTELTLSSAQHYIKNGTPTTLNFVKGSRFGYSSGYRAIVLGDTATSPNNVTIAIGYDPSGNTSGSGWTGNGKEVLFRNAAEFMTANSDNTSFIKPLKWDASGNTTLLGTTLTTLNGTDATDSSSSTTGAFKTAGGLGVAKSLFVGATITATTRVTAGTHFSYFENYGFNLRAVSGGWAKGFKIQNAAGTVNLGQFGGTGSEDTLSYLFAGLEYNDANVTKFYPATGNVRIGGALNIDSTTDSTSTTTGSIQTDGGLGVAKSAFIGNGATIMSPSLGFALKLDNAGSDGGTNAWWVAPTGGGYTAGDNKLVVLYNSASSGGSLLTIDGANLKTGIGYGNYSPSATLDVKSYLTTDIGLIVRGVLSQTANLQEWRNSTGTVLASMSPSGAFTAVTKSFDIEHPTKEGKRLRYGSLEGPENGVYVRGKNDSHVITLPDYWTGLVDPDSITVQLTSNGKFQPLYVEEIKDNSVIVGGVEGEYFYFIQAERIDVDKLVVEYGS